jgi:uncharacterized membrane protein (TIGR02234 family)
VPGPISRPAARRELAVAGLLCAAGAGLVVTAAGRQWAAATITGAGTPISQQLTGRELAGAAAALGWAGLAGLAALVAVSGRARVAVGGLLAVFGAGAAAASAAGVRRAHVLAVLADKNNFTAFLSTDLQTGSWWAASAAGGVLLAAAGLLTIVRGGRWPGMSARYDRGGAGGRGAAADPGEPDPSRLWKSLDRGEDPTAGTASPGNDPGEGTRADGLRCCRYRLAGEGVV